jgi:hypothetical protein
MILPQRAMAPGSLLTACGPGGSTKRRQLSISGTRASRRVPCCAIGLDMIPRAGRSFDGDTPMRFTNIGNGSTNSARALNQAGLRSSSRLTINFITMPSSCEIFFWVGARCVTITLPRLSRILRFDPRAAGGASEFLPFGASSQWDPLRCHRGSTNFSRVAWFRRSRS